MRTIVATAIILGSGLAVGSAWAEPYRWCAENVNGCGSSNCSYTTLEQCRAAASGNGGHCSLNGFYTGPDTAAPRHTKKRR